MKKAILIFALAAFTASFAQVNKNQKKETTVTKTTVVDNEGKDVATKAVTETSDQVIALQNSDAGQVNQNTLMLPVKVNTEVSYSNSGTNYMFEAEKLGFRMVDVKAADDEIFAVLRPSSQKGYFILSQDGTNSLGYFNQAGNFVVESYDSDADAVVTTVYLLKNDKKNISEPNKM